MNPKFQFINAVFPLCTTTSINSQLNSPQELKKGSQQLVNPEWPTGPHQILLPMEGDILPNSLRKTTLRPSPASERAHHSPATRKTLTTGSTARRNDYPDAEKQGTRETAHSKSLKDPDLSHHRVTLGYLFKFCGFISSNIKLGEITQPTR